MLGYRKIVSNYVNWIARTALPKNLCSGHHKATEEEHLKRDRNKETWTAGFRYSLRKFEVIPQHRVL